MDRKKKIAIISVVLVIAVVAAVLGFLFLDKIAAQVICILAVMTLAATVLVLCIDKGALHTLVMAAVSFVGPMFLQFFEVSELVEWLRDWYNAAVAFVCRRMSMEIPGEIGNQTALVITFCIIFVVIYMIVLGLRSWLGEKSNISTAKAKTDKDFLELDYQQKRKSFCRFLARRIEIIDEETKWDHKTFTPIEAMVEMTDKHRKKRRYDDLHACLRRYRRKNAVFLVLGDPGSGKSVSMRKLCMDMMKESEKTGLIPVYVDLKRWMGNWSLEHPPTEDDLVTFIERILREDGTTIEAQFLQDNFRKMLEWGQWYFVFDSFDEIPCLMGRKSSKKLIDKFSRLLYSFLTRENQHGGVIASRLFHSPTDALHATLKLNLQPFSDDRIHKMLNRYTKNADKLIRNLFGSREDLVALCRNPFYLSLLIEYSQKHGANLPKNQLELYETILQSRLNDCTENIDELGLMGVQQVLDATHLMAMYIQESDEFGLECPLSELKQRYNGYEWEKILKLLREARLCRFGGANPTASFAHRRFQEYFYVCSIMDERIWLDPESYNSIENNNGIRDALVLYCEIAPLERSREIADHCWSVLQQHQHAFYNIRKPGCVELVNTLYFMTEAFRNRREAMAHFLADFHAYAMKMLLPLDFVVQLAAVNSMILFEQPQLLEMVQEVLQLNNRYLSEVVMKNCRTMNEIPWEITHRMALYLAGMDRKTFMRQYRSMDCSLSVSNQLWYVRLVHTFSLIHRLLYHVLIILNPLILFWASALGYQLSDSLFTKEISVSVGMKILQYPLVVGLLLAGMAVSLIIDTNKQAESDFTEFMEFSVGLLLMPFAVGFAVVSGRMWIYLPFCIVMGVYCLILIIPACFYKQWKMGSVVSAVLVIVCIEILWLMLLLDKPDTVISSPTNEEFLQAILLLMLVPLMYLLKHVLRTIEQKYWIQKLTCVDELDRSELEKNLEWILLWDIFRISYLEELIERKVKLTGEWTNGRRPEEYQDDVTRLLTILDCADFENLRSDI